jgi:Peptidase M15
MRVPGLLTARAVATLAATAVVLALAACGSQGPTNGTGVSASSPQAHPQVIEPTAGVQSSKTTPDTFGDVHAHAEPISEVKRELKLMNLCGGALSSAEATPVTSSGGPGFVADPGTSQTEGLLPELTAQLNALGKALKVTIYGISGYRTPAQSVAVGGYANDPHTLGEAEDIGVNSLLRSSAAQITEAALASFDLYRPFDPSDNPSNTEVNHIQLIPAGGPLSLVEADGTLERDPRCQ